MWKAVLLIHGFNTNHWRFNQPVLAQLLFAIHDLLGFRSDQPRARLDESVSADAVHYGFDLWGQQVVTSAAKSSIARCDW